MQAKDLISKQVFPLHKNDTVVFALEMLLAHNLGDLPVIDNGNVIGLIRGIQLIDAKKSMKIEPFIEQYHVKYFNEYQHFYEVIKWLGEGKYSCIPVLNENNNFEGIITKEDILGFLSKSHTMNAEGGVICIETSFYDYSMAEISRIVENEDIKILGLSVYAIPDSTRILINLKLNSIYLDRLLSSLNRFGYEIIASFNKSDDTTDFTVRYNVLMKYLEL